MLLKKAFPAAAVWTAHQSERPVGDVGKDVVRNLGIIFGKAELGQALILPKHPVRVRELHPGKFNAAFNWLCQGHGVVLLSLPSRWSSLIGHLRCAFGQFEMDLLRRFVLAQAFESCL